MAWLQFHQLRSDTGYEMMLYFKLPETSLPETSEIKSCPASGTG